MWFATLLCAPLLSFLPAVLRSRGASAPPPEEDKGKGLVMGRVVHQVGYNVPDAPFEASTLVVRLPSGGLLVYSPGPGMIFAEHVSTLGEPEVVVVPSAWHCTYAYDFQKVFPNATYVASAGAVNNLRCPLNITRVDHFLAAEPRPTGDGFTVSLPEALAPLLEGFKVYQYPYHSMELVMYHAPSGTLLTCDLAGVIHEFVAREPEPTWDTPGPKFASPLGFAGKFRHHYWIAADCTHRPFLLCVLTNYCDDLMWGLAENCSNWKVDPVAMLRSRQFLSSSLALPGGVYTAHWAVFSQAEFSKEMIFGASHLRRYELMSRLSECANVSGASMVLQPCDGTEAPVRGMPNELGAELGDWLTQRWRPQPGGL